MAIFAKFLSNIPLSGQKSHFFKDFVPLSGFDRLASMVLCSDPYPIPKRGSAWGLDRFLGLAGSVGARNLESDWSLAWLATLFLYRALILSFK